MPRVAIISDIHSNLAALEAVLADIDRTGVDAVWCLGDIVGYGPEPSRCLAVVRQRASLGLSGNHDLGAIGAISLGDFNPHAASANRWTGQVLTDEEKAYLGTLPTMLVSGEFTLAHGSPREPVWEYVLSSDVAVASFNHFETRLCLVGHSHVPLLCPEPSSAGPCQLSRASEGVEVSLAGGRFIINPGSVGQPRDGDRRASYAIYDTHRQAIRYVRVPYDIHQTQKKMEEVGLPTRLVERLAYGR